MEQKKRILLITTRLFSPADSGRKYLLSNYCKGLNQKYGYDIYQYSFLESGQTPDDVEKQPDMVKEIVLAEKLSLIEKMLNLFKLSLFGKKLPLQCALFYSKRNERKIKSMIERIKPDAVYVELLRLAPYYDTIKETEAIKILDMCDLFSNNYKRQIENIQENSEVNGNYKLPKIISKLINLVFFRKLILKYEIKRLIIHEKKFALLFDKTILVSSKETQILNEIVGTKKAHCVTMGSDIKTEDIEIKKAENAIVFLGNMYYNANADSLHILINKILPLVKTNYILNIIGKCPEEIKERYNSREDIVFSGYADSLYKAVKENSLCVFPFAYGSGIKTKIIESMAMRMPIITNSIGIEGIDVINSEHIIVEDDYSNFANRIDELLNDKNKADALGSNALKLIEEKYQWDHIWEEFGEMGL